jgi:dTDP-glucose pyrophosphorylase
MTLTKLQVVMPMAGRGQRFRAAGFTVPKPLVLVDGKPMFLRALDSIVNVHCDLFVVIQRDVNNEYDLTSKIKAHYAQAFVKVLDTDTRGAAESVISLAENLNLKAPLLILDCDLIFESQQFLNLIEQGDDISADGLLLAFDSDDPRYSYVKSRDGMAVEVREKIVISEHALVGAYFWKVAGDFVQFTKKCIAEGINENQREFFISNTFQKAIESGASFRVIKGKFQSFGTPEELESYNSNIHSLRENP